MAVWNGFKERSMQEYNDKSRSTAILASIVLNALNSLVGSDRCKPVEPNDLLPYPQLEKLKNPYLKIVSRKTRKWLTKAHEEGTIPPNMERALMQNSELWEAIFIEN